LGAISAGIDQPMGADTESPASATVIQTIATLGSVVRVAPMTVSPSSIPATRIVLRTRVGSSPRRISASTRNPPTARSATAATSHGTAV
jgi:hypothetical protein